MENIVWFEEKGMREREHRRRGLFFLYNRCKDANVQTFTEKNESELDKRDITKIKK